MSLTQKHYTSFLATINEKKDELETLIDRLQLDTRHRTYMTTGTQVIIIGKQTCQPPEDDSSYHLSFHHLL